MDAPLRYTFRDPPPWPHQKRALAKLLRLNGKGLLAMPMRTGKSRVAIDWSGIAFHNYGLRRVLIVCPISVIDVWRDEIEKHCPVPHAIHALRNTAKTNAAHMRNLIGGPGAEDWPINDNAIRFVLVNYEMVWRQVAEEGPRGGKHSRTLDSYLTDWKPDLVIADEAHKLKNPQSRQSKALARLGAAAKMRLALTGTPVTKWPLDVYGLFRFADPGVFPGTWADFKDTYAVWQPAKYEPRIKEIVRYQNLDQLVEKVRAHSFRVKLEDVVDMPEKTFQTIRVPLSPITRRIYDSMAREMIAELENGKVATADIVLTKLMRLSQITSGFVKTEDGEEMDVDDGKLNACLELVENIIEQDEKVVIFCRFKRDYHRLATALTHAGIEHRMLTGEMKEWQRAEALARFRHDRDVTVFIAQIQSGSLGIDLSAARLAIFYSLDYNWATYQQAQDRILSIRNIRPLGYYSLVVPNSIDVLQQRVLRERGDLAEAILHRPHLLVDNSSQ